MRRRRKRRRKKERKKTRKWIVLRHPNAIFLDSSKSEERKIGGVETLESY
jgi:hypothetical protein